jgi:hypothetical protein
VISIRWFIDVMHEGCWRNAGVATTLAAAERLADDVYDETGGRDVRIISRRSRRSVTDDLKRGTP